MRLRRYGLLMLATWCVACAEVPTGTESGNPSMPGAHTPVPNLPPAAPPLPVTPVQPGPTAPTEVDPANQHTESTESVDSSTTPVASSSEPSTGAAEGVPGPPWPGTIPTGPVAGTAGVPTTVDGAGETPSTTSEPTVTDDAAPSFSLVDAGDAGGVDAGP